MTEPTTTASAVIATAVPAMAVPLVTLLGINTGLRPDLLLAGFFGGLVAIVILDNAPGATDNWRTLLATSTKRLMVMVSASLTAAYLAPISEPIIAWLPGGLAHQGVLAVAFLIGAGAQRTLSTFVERMQATLAGRTAPAEGKQ